MKRLGFGVFTAPFHLPNARSAHRALHRDVELTQLYDRLGFDEIWFGEHHSCGAELISDPLLMMAYCAPKTERIRLGSGVISLPYHNPMWMADRIVMLDHLTSGRAIFGLGPGALATDAVMVGIDPVDQRDLFEQDVDVLMHLLRSTEPLSVKTSRYVLNDALVQSPPFSDVEVLIAAVMSPSGPRIAGKHGLNLLSLAATSKATVLAEHQGIVQSRAHEFGMPVPSRDGWRLVGNVHIAETREEAYNQVRWGIDSWFDYRQHVTPSPQFSSVGDTTEERIEAIIDSGLGVIGTPSDAIEHIQRLWEISGGGYGTFLISANEWARDEDTMRSMELFADAVMPAFQFRELDRRKTSEATARARGRELHRRQSEAIEAARRRHEDARTS